jgi:Tfp pilus assembly protein PilV
MSHRQPARNSGSTLLEVLVAVMITGLVLTAVMLTLTFSIKNSADSRYRIVASQLAQEGLEVVKLQREMRGWGAFTTAYPTSSYCAPVGTITLTTSCSAYSDPGTKKSFVRTIQITQGTNEATATVRVDWVSDSGTGQSVEVKQELKKRVGE